MAPAFVLSMSSDLCVFRHLVCSRDGVATGAFSTHTSTSPASLESCNTHSCMVDCIQPQRWLMLISYKAASAASCTCYDPEIQL